MKYRCKECKTVVDMHYDHVGPNCDAGDCAGTFKHVTERYYNARMCSFRGRDLRHGDVEPLLVYVDP
jgi:hypothetical protein